MVNNPHLLTYETEKKKIKFFPANIDNSGDPKYYGFTGNDFSFGNLFPWYILKENTAAGTYQYIFGNYEYDNAWTIRATLTYDHASKFYGFFKMYEVSS